MLNVLITIVSEGYSAAAAMKSELWRRQRVGTIEDFETTYLLPFGQRVVRRSKECHLLRHPTWLLRLAGWAGSFPLKPDASGRLGGGHFRVYTKGGETLEFDAGLRLEADGVSTDAAAVAEGAGTLSSGAAGTSSDRVLITKLSMRTNEQMGRLEERLDKLAASVELLTTRLAPGFTREEPAVTGASPEPPAESSATPFRPRL